MPPSPQTRPPTDYERWLSIDKPSANSQPEYGPIDRELAGDEVDEVHSRHEHGRFIPPRPVAENEPHSFQYLIAFERIETESKVVDNRRNASSLCFGFVLSICLLVVLSIGVYIVKKERRGQNENKDQSLNVKAQGKERPGVEIPVIVEDSK